MLDQQTWTYEREPDSKTWNVRWRFWRAQVKFTVHRHGSHLGDRWVLQPHFIYDRKAARTGGPSDA